MTNARRAGSIALAVAGAFLVLIGGLLFYAREAIFDSDSFADRATETLSEPRVQEAVTQPIVNAIIDSGPPELINAQPLLEAGVGGVIDSSAFRDTFHDAVRSTHSALFEGDVERLALTLGDASVIAIGAVRNLSPEISRQIPRDVDAELIEITDNTTLEIAPLTHDVRLFGIVLPLLGFALLAGSVAMAPVRRIGLIQAGAATAVAAGIGIALLLVGRTLVAGQFDDPIVHDAVLAAWDSLLGDLVTWFMLLGGAAVIVAAAAYAGVREVDPAAPLRKLGQAVAWTPERPSLRLLRAVTILGVSLLFVLRPELGVSIVAVAIGGWGLFVAATEILLVVAPPPAGPAAPGARERAAGLLSRVRPQRAVALFGAGAALVVLILLLTGGDAERRPGGPVTACNGHPELCDRSVREVSFPATHNSMSAAREHGWYLPNQRHGLRRQLEDGIRVFLIDTHYGIETEGGTVVTDISRESATREELETAVGPEGVKRVQRIRDRLLGDADPEDARPHLCHVACELGATELTDALTDVREFLDGHPDEFVVLFVEDVVTPQDAERAFEESGILRYAYVQDPDAPLPTLRQLIEADRRVLIIGEKQSGGEELPWYQAGFELVQETPYTFKSEQEIAAAAGCRPNRGHDNNPLLQINNWIEKVPRSPALAGRVNSFETLLTRARLCERRRGMLPNLIAVDHYDQGDLFEVVNELNGLQRRAEPQVRSTD